MKGSKNQICSETTGKCPCKEKFDGTKCDGCAPGIQNEFPNCQGCDKCRAEGTEKCDKKGDCICKNSLIEPLKCDDCIPGAYGFPACKGTYPYPAFLNHFRITTIYNIFFVKINFLAKNLVQFWPL